MYINSAKIIDNKSYIKKNPPTAADNDLVLLFNIYFVFFSITKPFSRITSGEGKFTRRNSIYILYYIIYYARRKVYTLHYYV